MGVQINIGGKENDKNENTNVNQNFRTPSDNHLLTKKVNINIDIKTIAGPEEKVDLFPTLHAINLNFLLIFYLKMSAEEWKETFFCRNDVLQPI